MTWTDKLFALVEPALNYNEYSLLFYPKSSPHDDEYPSSSPWLWSVSHEWIFREFENGIKNNLP